ncbi:hypothetical protein [Lacticaseibacillus nasuensis]|uniref:Uncharacterized protein n=1 Tax=Lacticaseibacillus nasuensis JCM 17158 TaxID=1291734 RepID=A0A0R1JKK2_9LACO|nr:hypothetical protein [Lacticaseibacillus nasuensis]KRK71885.1 hypothetical protein FD02_GL002134 [Lacticaseibacillus nasuensis JCM 17158]
MLEMSDYQATYDYAMAVADDYIDPERLKKSRFFYYVPFELGYQFDGAFLPEDADDYLTELIHRVGYDRLIAMMATSSRDRNQLEDEIADCWFGSQDYKYSALDLLEALGYQKFDKELM